LKSVLANLHHSDMIKYKISLFGITRDIVGGTHTSIEFAQQANVESLLAKLRKDFPRLNDIRSLLVAVNAEYAEGNFPINEQDEIALIPPVSGG
jgi:molybdopterin converting factor subunit 1